MTEFSAKGARIYIEGQANRVIPGNSKGLTFLQIAQLDITRLQNLLSDGDTLAARGAIRRELYEAKEDQMLSGDIGHTAARILASGLADTDITTSVQLIDAQLLRNATLKRETAEKAKDMATSWTELANARRDVVDSELGIATFYDYLGRRTSNSDTY